MSKGMAVPLPKKEKEPKQPKQQQPPSGPTAAGPSGSGWSILGNVNELFTLEKPNRAIVLPSGVKLCIYKFGSKVFASQLESTAYQFPLFDGKVSMQDGRVVVEVPLDGTQVRGKRPWWPCSEGGVSCPLISRPTTALWLTNPTLYPNPMPHAQHRNTTTKQYDLATGQVLKWCPSEGNMLRSVLGALKSKQPSVPLKVYPVSVAQDGTLSVKLI